MDRRATVTVGLDVYAKAAQRDAAFAKMYEADERCEKLLTINARQWDMIIDLCELIAHDETLHLLDPEGALICKARTIIATMQLYPRGRAALERRRTTCRQ